MKPLSGEKTALLPSMVREEKGRVVSSFSMTSSPLICGLASLPVAVRAPATSPSVRLPRIRKGSEVRAFTSRVQLAKGSGMGRAFCVSREVFLALASEGRLGALAVETGTLRGRSSMSL